jgi:probable HAF family extracellular repeat protein
MRTITFLLALGTMTLIFGSCTRDKDAPVAALAESQANIEKVQSEVTSTSLVVSQEHEGVAKVRSEPQWAPQMDAMDRRLNRRHEIEEKVILAEEESPPDANGKIRRTILVERKGKYPLIRREKIIQANNPIRENTYEMVGNHLLVTLVPDADVAAFKADVNALGYSLEKHLRGTATYIVGFQPTSHVEMDIAQTKMRTIPGVVSSEPDFVVSAQIEPSDPQFSQQWALKNDGRGQLPGETHADISAPPAWDRHTGSLSIKVAVIDTGIDLTHPDLAANIWVNPGETGVDSSGHDKASNGVDDDNNGYIDDINGWNFYSDTNNPNDDNLHGTHVAGTIGAVGNNGIGVSGVCWNVSLVPIKFLDKYGDGYNSDGVQAVAYATAIGVHVMNASWGGVEYSQTLANVIGSAGQRGILFVAAAGNDGANIDGGAHYPAGYTEANIIAVAATDRSDHLSEFSNYGPGTVVIAAPGSDIFSTMPHVATEEMTFYGFTVNYDHLSGTSMAAPHISGALALLKSANPTYTAEQLRATLLARADHLPNLTQQVAGGARLDLGALLDPNWTAKARVGLTEIALNDQTGNNDKQANPGEVIDLYITVSNQGSRQANNVTVSYVSATSGVTIITGNSSFENLPPVVQAQAVTPIRLKLGSDIVDGTEVNGTLTIKWTGGSASVPYSFTVVGLYPQASRIVPFPTNTPVADPVRNRVYVVDLLTPSILAINTDSGRLDGRILLDQGSSFWGGVSVPRLAVSIDGAALAVSLPGSQRIQEYALPGLTLKRTINTQGEPVAYMAYGYNNRLCYTQYESGSPGHPASSGLYIIDPVTSNISSPANSSGTAPIVFYESAYIKASADGTRLWLMNTALTSSDFYEFGLDQQPRYLRRLAPRGAGGAFIHDPTNNRLLIGKGGVMAIDLGDSLSYNYWAVPHFERHGAAMATISGEPYLFSAWGDDVWGAYGGRGMDRQGIARLRRSDGKYMGSIPTPIGWNIPVDSLAETKNRRLFYHKNTSLNLGTGEAINSSLLGLVGSSSLDVELYPVARFTSSSTVTAPRKVNFNGALSISRSGQPLYSYQWDFGDGTSGTGATINHVYAAAGDYNVTLTVRDNLGLPDRSIAAITVSSTPLLATPIAYNAVYTTEIGGQSQLKLTGAGGSIFSVDYGPMLGSLSGSPPNLTYTVPESVEASQAYDRFTFTVSNGIVTSAPASVVILLTEGLASPVAKDQTVTVASGVNSPITLQATLRGHIYEQMTILSGPSHGQLRGTPPWVTYQSDDQYVGNDSFTFTSIKDNQRSAPATVSIQIVAGYTLTDLGSIGGSDNYAMDINEQGMVAGYTYDRSNGVTKAFTWKAGTTTWLPSLAGGIRTKAFAINNLGSVVGVSETSVYDHAVCWTNAKVTDLGKNTTGETGSHYSQALDINDNGVVVGSFDNRARRWVNNVRQTLDNPGSWPGSSSNALCINNNGISGGVGQDSNNQSRQRAYKWDNALVPMDVTPTGISDYAEIVVVLNDDSLICNTGNNNGRKIYRISGGNATLIGDGWATGANNLGAVVGYRTINNQSGEVEVSLWQNGSVVDLNDLVSPISRSLNEARAINVHGAIVGNFQSASGIHGYVLNPNINRVPLITAGPSGPTLVTTTTANFSVTANDPDGAPQALTYSWSVVSGPGTVTFTPNGTAAANLTNSSFTTAGDYRIRVDVSDGAAMASKELSIVVDAKLAAFQVLPMVATANVGDEIQFTSRATDQFGLPLREINNITWTTSGGGLIDNFGRFQATSVGGPFTIMAQSGSASGISKVQVTSAFPAPWKHADFGEFITPGSATYTSGVFSIHSDTNMLLSNYHAVYQTIDTNASITVRLLSSMGKGTPLVTLRNDTTNGSTPQISIVYWPSYGVIQMSTIGMNQETYPYIPVTLPCWIRLERIGNSVIGKYSQDANAWADCGTVTYPLTSQATVGMGLAGGYLHDPVADYVQFDNARVDPLTNAAPVAVADTFSTNEDVALSITNDALLTNDSDIDGNTLSLRVISQPTRGILSQVSGGYLYQPNADAFGNDIFTYVVNDGFIDSAPATVTVAVAAVEDPLVNYKPGLLAEFFDYTTTLTAIPALNGRIPEVTRTDNQIAYASVTTAWAGLPTTMVDTFASRHSGWLKVDTAGSYTVFIKSDDGSRLFLDGALVINNDGAHGMRERSAVLMLSAGYHRLVVEFFEGTGGAGLEFRWSGPGIAKQLVPASALWQAGDPPLYQAGLKAEFFDYVESLSLIPDLSTRTADVTRTDSQINYPNVSTAWTGLPTTMADTFASKHSGWLKIDTQGSYTLYLNSNEGSKLYLNGQMLINNDGLHDMLERSATLNLAPGFHQLQVEFFENIGSAGLGFRWSGPGISKRLVPASALWHTPAGVVGVPPPWISGAVGVTAITGSAVGNGTDFSISGGGSGIDGTADSFHFVYQPLTSNGEMIARVAVLQNINPLAMAGVMIRASTAANSANIFMSLTPTGGAAFQSRIANAATTSRVVISGKKAPYWVRLVRIGTSITGWISPDGATWTQVGAAVNVPLGATPVIGLGVTSTNTATRALAIFDQVIFLPYEGG